MALINLAREQVVLDVTAQDATVVTADQYRNGSFRGLAMLIEVTAGAALDLTPLIFWDFPSGANASYIYDPGAANMTAQGEYVYVYAPAYLAAGGTATDIIVSTLPLGDFRFQMVHGNAVECAYTVDVVMF